MDCRPEDSLFRYVRNMPQPGSGRCHVHIIGAVTVGIKLGLDDHTIHDIILSALDKHPTVRQTSRSIMHALNKVRRNGVDCNYVPRQRYPMQTEFRDRLSVQNRSIEDAESLSPVRLSGRPVSDSMIMLDALFRREEQLYVGPVFGAQIATVQYWLENPSKWNVHIIPNPLDGGEYETSSGSISRRCDAAVVEWRYCVCEFDDLPLEKQISIWLNIKLPVVAMIYSGGKSIHAWIKISASRAEFDEVKEFYEKNLITLGVDQTCRNPSRLSRMPGVWRADKGRAQKLIYLNPTAR